MQQPHLSVCFCVCVCSCLNHPNLVKLHGIMIKPRFRLVIELVVRGDLSNLLHPPLGRQVSGWLPGTRGTISKEDFPWRLRLLIALDVARGMRYLASLNPPIVHRDLRSPNIFVRHSPPPVVSALTDRYCACVCVCVCGRGEVGEHLARCSGARQGCRLWLGQDCGHRD